VARLTTKDHWVFQPYSIESRGHRNVPTRYLKEARWRTIGGNTGYYVDVPTRPSRYYPVEFNFPHFCWCETTWSVLHQRWNITRPTGDEYRCNIFEDEVIHDGDQGPIDGQEDKENNSILHNPRTPAPSTTEGSEGDASEPESATTGEPGNTTEESQLAALAESIHINPPETMTTMTEPVRERIAQIENPIIDPHTGHIRGLTQVNVEDEAALRRARGPDHPDPPSGPEGYLRYDLPLGNPGGGPPGRGGGSPGGGFPGNGPPGGGFPRGGPPGGGFPGGGPPQGGPPLGAHAPQPAGKFVGDPPMIFDGNRKNTQMFTNQWDLYWGVNNDNPLLANPYRRAMFFLTYIKGSLVNEFVVTVSRWLNRQIQGGIPTTDERLWGEVARSFTQRFANNMEKEEAQAQLRRGIKMKEGDIDAYVAQFEELAQMAGYRLDEPQTIDTFTAGLPLNLYLKTFELDQPRTYQQWREAVVKRQQQYIHARARMEAHKNSNPKPRIGGWAPRGQLPHPDAMDTSAGRTRGRLAGSEDVNYHAPPYTPRGGFMQRGRGRGRPHRDIRERMLYMSQKRALQS